MTTYLSWWLIWYKENSMIWNFGLTQTSLSKSTQFPYTQNVDRIWLCSRCLSSDMLSSLFCQICSLGVILFFSVLFLPITSPKPLLNYMTSMYLESLLLPSEHRCLVSQDGWLHSMWLHHKHILIYLLPIIFFRLSSLSNLS